MVTVITLNIIFILFAYISRYTYLKNGLKISFVLIFLFLALRYNYGNDYKSYFEGFITINQFKEIDFFDKSLHFEPGWIILCRLFKSIGFFAMVASLALFTCIVYYNFIKKYVPVKYYWFATFIYVFNPLFMLTQISAMRQSLAITLFIISIDYIYKKKIILYILCIGIASLIHTSALLLLPAYLLAYYNGKINKLSIIIYFSIFIMLFVFIESLAPFINRFIGNYFSQYEVYTDPGVVGSGLGIIYSALLLILLLSYDRFQNKKTSIIFKIAIISFMFIPLSINIQLIGRIVMYFGTATIIAYPIILMNLKKTVYKIIFVTTLMFITTFQFFQFFYSDVWKDAFGTYQTILTASKIY